MFLATGHYFLRIPLESEWVKLYEYTNNLFANDPITHFSDRFVPTGTVENNLHWSGSISDNVPDASNVRYHVHRAHDIYKASPFNFDDMDYQMGAYVAQGPSINGRADGSNLYFGSQGGFEWARASDLIYHEYTHNVIAAIYGAPISSGSFELETRAMDEGIPDYFACSFTEDPIFGESVGLSRNLDNSLTFSPSNDFYWNGQVIGGAIWDVRGATDPTTADRLAFTALQITPHARTFEAFGYNMLLADREHNGGSNDSIIRSAFSGHGITIRDTPGNGDAGGGGSVAIDTVEIVGPDSLRNWQNGTWEARVEGGNPPYAYQWEYKPLCGWRREASCGTWAFGGSEPSYSRMANSSFDFELKLTVTDNARHGVSSTNSSSKIAYKTVYTIAGRFLKNGADENLQQRRPAEQQVLPDSYALEGNYPNPFNPSTEIQFALPEASKVSLVVYDMTGRVVAELLDGSLEIGIHSVTWNASNLPSGTYVYRLQADAFTESKLMTLLK